MDISYLKLIRAFPSIHRAIKAVKEAGWFRSKTIWYQIIKTGLTLAGACGIKVVLSDQDAQTVSAALAVLVPSAILVCDAFASAWLRTRTHESLQAKADRAKQ